MVKEKYFLDIKEKAMRARENLLAFSILISLLILFDISCNFAPYEGEAKIG